jgi:hypothetical protein
VRAVFVLLLLASPVVWSQSNGPPAELVSKCSEAADDDVVGLHELELICPGLARALTELAYAPFISEGESDTLDRYALMDLLALHERFREFPRRTSQRLDTGQLPAILDALGQEQVQRPKTWFERVNLWLRNLLDRKEADSDSWLSRWLERIDIPPTVTRIVGYGLIVLVVVLALVVIIVEVRAARIVRRGHQAAAVADSSTPIRFKSPTLSELDTADAASRPSILLRLLMATLTQTGRLSAEQSLTHRELETKTSFDNVDQLGRFRQVALLAEQTLYGDRLPAADESERVLTTGRALYAELTSRGART